MEYKEIIDHKKKHYECFNCNKHINNEPWMTVDCGDNYNIYCCSYICSKKMKHYMGGISYWDKIVNKEDFTKYPLPIQYKSKKIYFNESEIELIKQEIEEIEEEMINNLEYSDPDESMSDEEYYFK